MIARNWNKTVFTCVMMNKNVIFILIETENKMTRWSSDHIYRVPQDQIIFKIFIIWSLWTITFMFIHADARIVTTVDSNPYRKLIASKMDQKSIWKVLINFSSTNPM